jgi:hypothetical protein
LVGVRFPEFELPFAALRAERRGPGGFRSHL